MLCECTQYPHGSFMGILWGISKIFCNVSVNFLCNYKKDFFSRHFVYNLENEEIYTEQNSLFTILQVLKRIEVNQVVEKTFKKCKSAGYKKIHHRARDGYAGLSKRQVLKCVTSNERLGKFYVSFTNKPKSRLTSLKIIQEQHQINLVDIKSLKVEYKGKCYRYIFFADGHIFAISLAYQLTRKKSSHVKKKLQ